LFIVACGSRKKEVEVNKAVIDQIAVVSKVEQAAILDTSTIKTTSIETFDAETTELVRFDTVGRITELVRTVKSKGKKNTHVVDKKAFKADLSTRTDSMGKTTSVTTNKSVSVKRSSSGVIIFFILLVLLALFLLWLWKPRTVL
jgi:cobalamin biosynthesis Mg chelatase CobN